LIDSNAQSAGSSKRRVCEQFVDRISAQSGYTVPFTSVHAGKCKTEDKSRTNTLHKLNTTQKVQTTQKTAKQNQRDLVTSYDTRPGNEVSLFYNAPEPTQTARSSSMLMSSETFCRELQVSEG